MINLWFSLRWPVAKESPATVVWANSVGCGVKFMPVNNRDVQIVDDLIYFVEAQRTDRRDVLDKILKKVG